MSGKTRGLVVLVLWVLVGTVAMAGPRLGISDSGHRFTLDGRPVVLVGDSGTQCVLQNANLDYRRWVDDCAACGLNAVHVWALLAPRQTQDGSVMEARYGYVYPGLTPWARRTGGRPASDGLPRWDLTRFDEGEGPGHYWWRLRDLCRYAGSRGLVVGVTVFFGWPKHQSDWLYHPFNRVNGGHLRDSGRFITQTQMIAEPGTEVLGRRWSARWPAALKTQWVWERFADRLVRDLVPLGNVFFVFMDEHSYSEGNCGDHFAQFFRRRGALWADWVERRDGVDIVACDTLESVDKSAYVLADYRREPAKPVLFLEGHPYAGDGVLTSLWSVLMAGGHFVFHNDADQETPQTGIMGYDPHVRGGDVGAMRRQWHGHACRVLNGVVNHLDQLAPHSELCSQGAWCLALPGREYLVYVRGDAPGPVTLDLRGIPGTLACRAMDPRTGVWVEEERVEGGAARVVWRVGSGNRLLHLQVDRRYSGTARQRTS